MPLSWLLIALGLLASAIALHSIFIAPRTIKVSEIDAAIAGLPPAFDGYTIGVLTDIHQSALPGLAHTRRAVEVVRRARPDVVALLGDYGVSFKLSYAASRPLYRWMFRVLAPVVRSLAAGEAPDGVLAVLGNHDYYYNGPAVRQWLESLGVRVLVNERAEVTRGDGAARARLAIAGVDDLREGRLDPAAGCADLPADVPRVVLSHNPDGVLRLAPEVRPALVLSGHTHGGQVVVPLYGAPLRWARVCDRKHASGWVPNARAPLYVSAGVGSQVPLRFLCPPEVVIVRLRAATA